MDDPVILLQLYPLTALFLAFLFVRGWIEDDAAEPVAVR